MRYKCSRFTRSPISTGIVPERLLWWSCKDVKFDKLAISVGIEPSSSLSLRPRCCKFVRLPISGGMIPTNLFPLSCKLLNFFKLPISIGMESLSWLVWSHNICKSDKFPISAGIVPTKLFAIKFIAVTRPSDTVIPCQVEMGCPVSQFVLFVQLAPLVLLYRATRARESPASIFDSIFQ